MEPEDLGVPPYNEVIDLHPNQASANPNIRLGTGEVEVHEDLLSPFPSQSEEDAVRNRKRFFNRIWKFLNDSLNRAEDLDAVLQAYSSLHGGAVLGDLEELRESMLGRGQLGDLLTLQTCLVEASKDGLSAQLADMAKAAQAAQEVNVMHFSLMPSDEEDVLTLPGQCQVMVYLGERDTVLLGKQLAELPDLLNTLFGSQRAQRFSTFRVVRSSSAWVTLLATQAAAEALRKALARQNLHNLLASWGITQVKFPKDQAEAVATPGVVKKEPVEPALKKVKLEPPEDVGSSSPERSPNPRNPSNPGKAAVNGEHQWLPWEKVDVLRYFNERCLSKAVLALNRLTFTGSDVPHWSLPVLRGLGLKDDIAKMIMDELGLLVKYRTPLATKLINDSVHGPMEFHPMCVKIIDTPEFQRLRNIKQLGSVYLVFPGAGHSRFEHSLGVGYLAHQLVRAIQNRQPELRITEVDVLCVSIAGLCHELGHGPHSHLFHQFMQVVAPGADWQHEDSAYMMFDQLIEKNLLRTEMFRYGLTERDIQFIREQVHGERGDRSKYKGRDTDRFFLYEMVARRQNGIDVNKWDYIARDSLMLGMANSFDYRRFVMHARVIWTLQGFRICARDNDADDHYKMFQSRYSLGRRAYFHKVHQSIEAMLVDVLVCVERSESIKYTGENRKELSLCECPFDPVAFTKLTDSVFDLVELSKSRDLLEARRILENIRLRRLYVMVAETEPSHVDIATESLPKLISTSDRVAVKKLYLDYGLKERDPIEEMLFYRKSDPDIAVKVSKTQVSVILPEKFSECIIRLYCKDTDKKSRKAYFKRFEKWCDDHALRIRSYRKP